MRISVAFSACLLLAACGGEPDAPAPPDADEESVLAEAAEMLPADTPVPETPAPEPSPSE